MTRPGGVEGPVVAPETTGSPLLIGLTGPIGCGKSTVARWITNGGGVVVDADALVREVEAPGQPGHAAVLARFGDGFRRPDGSLDSAALGRHVFSDPSALRDLESIVHPLVRPRIIAAIESARASGARVVAVEAIKLIEAGYAPMCDEVWLITCSPDEQLRRLEGRGLPRAAAQQRVRAQRGLSERLAPAATRILDTGGSPRNAGRRVARALSRAFAARAGQIPPGGRAASLLEPRDSGQGRKRRPGRRSAPVSASPPLDRPGSPGQAAGTPAAPEVRTAR